MQGDEIVERIRIVQFGRVNQTHEDVTDPGAVLGLVEVSVLPVQDRLLQGALTDIMPTPGLCRVGGARPAFKRANRISEVADAA